MRQLSRYLCMLAMVATAGCGVVAGDTQQTAPQPATPVQRATAAPSNPDAVILADFNARLDQYIRLQRALLKDSEPLKETKEPQDIIVAQELLASKIRNVRKAAKQGDIFAPPVAAMFKRLLNPELRGEEGREVRATVQDDGPAPGSVALTINGKYPQSQPLSTVPGNLLASLPQLPRDVEYRVVGKHLILRDVDANIIVDYIPNAIR